MLRNLQEHDSNYSDSLFVRIIACQFCCSTCNPRRKNSYKKVNEMEPFDNMVFLDMLGEGGFGKVYRCRDEANRIVAVKQISMHDIYNAVPGSIIREVSFLKELNHPNIVRLLTVVYKKGTRLVNLVLEYLDCDLNDYIIDTERCYDSSIDDPMTKKSFLYQILSAVEYCHSRKIIHRDLKPRNLLIDHSTKIIKLADFGLARELGDPDVLYSPKVATRFYRAPEILFECGQYSTPIDIWAVGCIFGEMVLGQPILRAIDCKDELETIFRMFGTPTEETWPGVTTLCANLQTYPKFRPMDLSSIFPALDPTGLNLLTRMLCLDPDKRISAESALRHAYFDDLDPSVTKKRPMTMEGGNNITEAFVTTMEGGSCPTNNKNVEVFVSTMEDGSTTPTNNNAEEFAVTLEGGSSTTKAEEIVMTMDGVSSPAIDNNNAEKFGMTVEDGTTTATSRNNAEEFSMAMEGGSSTTTNTNNNNAEAFAVGCLLSIRTTFGEEFEAQVVTFDHPSNILGLMEGSKDTPLKKVRLLNADYIQNFTFLGQYEDPLDPHNCYVDLNDLQAREELAIRQAEADAERIGVGVTNEAQNIFDALSKTLPVRWDKNVIVVMNEVRISSPYHPDCVIGGAPAANDRVKKVLEMLRKRLQLPCSGGQ